MRLVTYQSLEAVERLKKDGYLIMEEDKFSYTAIALFDKDNSFSNFKNAYEYIINRMNKLLPPKEDKRCFYPIWAWYKMNGKRKPTKVFDKIHKDHYRIIFEIDDEKVLLSDFDMFCYIAGGGLYFKKDPEKEDDEELDLSMFPTYEDFYDNYDQMLDINHKEDGYYYFSNRHNTVQATFWKLDLDMVIEIKKV